MSNDWLAVLILAFAAWFSVCVFSGAAWAQFARSNGHGIGRMSVAFLFGFIGWHIDVIGVIVEYLKPSTWSKP